MHNRPENTCAFQLPCVIKMMYFIRGGGNVRVERKWQLFPKWRREELSYLVSAGDAGSVEHREKEFWREDDDKCICNEEESKGRPEAVHLGGGPQDSDSWHEAGCQRQRYRAKAHLPSSDQELPWSCLFPLLYSKEHPNSRGNDKEGCKYNIIPNCEALGLHAGKFGSREFLSTGSQGEVVPKSKAQGSRCFAKRGDCDFVRRLMTTGTWVDLQTPRCTRGIPRKLTTKKNLVVVLVPTDENLKSDRAGSCLFPY